MIKLNVKLDIARAKESLKGLERQVDKAAARAINRAIDGGKATATREIASATKIKQKDVRARLFVKGATVARLVAELLAFPFSPNLSYFRATQNKKGVAASAWERRKTYRHAFINPRTGKVVTRTDSGRLKGLRGPSVPRTFLRKDMIGKIKDVVLTRFRSEFAREIKRRTS